MTPRSRRAFLFIILFSVLLSFMTACSGDSGYGVAPPYVISGTVTTGEAVSGTVYVLTYKRADRYQGAIDSTDGSYEISVWKHDPPYLVWAVLDGQRTLYSYTPGSRNPTDEEIAEAFAQAAENNEDPPIITFEQTVNITPLTDLFISLAYLEDTERHFIAYPDSGFPSESKISKFHDYTKEVFQDTLEYFDEIIYQTYGSPNEDPLEIYTHYNFFHGILIPGDFIDAMLYTLQVQYPVETGPDELREAKLLLREGLGTGDEIFYWYDMIEDQNVTGPYPMDSASALEVMKIEMGLPEL